jgi:hypothetical protein
MGTHKLAGNGLLIETALTDDELHDICGLAATQTKGDLWNGKAKVVKQGSTGSTDHYAFKGAWGRSNVLTFTVATEPAQNDRTSLRVEIVSFLTTRQTVVFIPVTPKKMTSHANFMEFVNKVANTVRAADPSANVDVRTGPGVTLGVAL